jgi:hypothetical protein
MEYMRGSINVAIQTVNFFDMTLLLKLDRILRKDVKLREKAKKNDDLFDIYKKTRQLTFKNILDQFFFDEQIKACFSVLLGNIGLSAGMAAAMPAVIPRQLSLKWDC